MISFTSREHDLNLLNVQLSIELNYIREDIVHGGSCVTHDLSVVNPFNPIDPVNPVNV